jgi:hypothetical protein
MVPPESLSQYLSNEYQHDQYCGVSIESKITEYFLHSDFVDRSTDLRP